MTLEDVERAIAERYAIDGFSISRKNTKTLIVELPYSVNDFDEFVLDMRLQFGCKIDYDLSENSSSTKEIRITPGVHQIFDRADDDDPFLKSPSSDANANEVPRRSLCSVCCMTTTVFAILVATVYTALTMELFSGKTMSTRA